MVPADDKDNARLIVSQFVLDALSAMKMSYPEVTAKRDQDLVGGASLEAEEFLPIILGGVRKTKLTPPLILH